MQSTSQLQPCILIVDDNAKNLSFLFDYLHKLGFKVLVGENGYEALNLAKQHHPDIILLDILMPGMNGFETCLRLKEQEETEAIPVIFMTALSGVDDIVRGFEVGGVDYITKPFQQREVLARIHTHLTIQRQRTMLLELNLMKNTFFSIIEDDMRHALLPLIGLSNLLSDDQFDRKNVPDVAKRIDGYVQHAYRLLENLMFWGKLNFDDVEFQPETVDLYNILLEVRGLLRAPARQKRITLVDEVEKQTYVYADQKMTGLIFRNLLANAIKFTPQDGSVTISARTLETQVQIIIADTGVGISETNLAKLFNIEQKFSTPDAQGETGSGLGLLLCKDLAEKQGGDLLIQSQEGKGVTCIVTLPKNS